MSKINSKSKVREYFTHFGFIGYKSTLIVDKHSIHLLNCKVPVGSQGYFTLKRSNTHPILVKFLPI